MQGLNSGPEVRQFLGADGTLLHMQLDRSMPTGIELAAHEWREESPNLFASHRIDSGKN